VRNGAKSCLPRRQLTSLSRLARAADPLREAQVSEERRAESVELGHEQHEEFAVSEVPEREPKLQPERKGIVESFAELG
jgi:hypothetical protein